MNLSNVSSVQLESLEDKRIGKQVDSKSIALHGVAGSSPVSSASLDDAHVMAGCEFAQPAIFVF